MLRFKKTSSQEIRVCSTDQPPPIISSCLNRCVEKCDRLNKCIGYLSIHRYQDIHDFILGNCKCYLI